MKPDHPAHLRASLGPQFALAPAFRFEGKQVWVTGAGRGIGYQIAMMFRALGARVTGLDLSFDDSAVTEQRQAWHSGHKAYPFRTCVLDIARADQVAQICQQLLLEHPEIDVLVNAAGVLKLGTVEQISHSDWHSCLDINLSGAFYLFQQLLPVFKRQQRGSIVTIASNAAHVPRLNMAAYCASKAALAALSNCAALELAAYGVRCNLVSPGSTLTPMLQGMLSDQQALQRTIAGLPEQFKLGIPLRKIADPAEIAYTVAFLASDLASHITMQDIVVDGGATLAA